MPSRVSSAYGAGGGAPPQLRGESWWQHGAASTRAPPTAPPGPARRRWRCRRRAGRGRRRAARQPDVVDAGRHEGRPRRRAEPLGDRGVVPRDCSFTSTPTIRTGSRAPREPAVRGEGQVGVAAAEVDHPQRLVRRRARAARRLASASSTRPEGAQELLDLAVLRLPARLDPALGVGDPELSQHRVVLGRAAGPSRGRGALGLPAAARPLACTSASPFLVTRSWWVSVGGLDVPVAERLGQQGVERGRAASSWLVRAPGCRRTA